MSYFLAEENDLGTGGSGVGTFGGGAIGDDGQVKVRTWNGRKRHGRVATQLATDDNNNDEDGDDCFFSFAVRFCSVFETADCNSTCGGDGK